MGFSQNDNKEGFNYNNTLSENDGNSNFKCTQKKHNPSDYRNDQEFSALLKKFKKEPFKSARFWVFFSVFIILEVIIFTASFLLRNSMFQAMIFTALGFTTECLYFFAIIFEPLDSDELLKLSKEMQQHFKINKKPLNKKQALQVLTPFIVCIVLGILLLIAGLAGIISIVIIYFTILEELSSDFTDMGTLLSAFYSVSHFLSGFGLLMTIYGAISIKNLNVYRCRCGCMFSFMSRQNYDYKSEIRKHEATYENRDVATGSIYSNGQKVGTIYKSESYEKTPASEWRHTCESWMDICCVCGKQKKRSSSSMQKIRNL